MKLSNLWKEKDVTLSFEAFPPKKDSDFDSVATAVEKIAQLKPDFMSVTYGAGGGTSTYTSQIAQIVQAQGVTALAHLTCVSSDRERIHHELDALKEALKGDNTDAIKSAEEDLTNKFYEVSQKIYEATQGAQGPQPGAAPGADAAQGGNDAGYTDADYTEVDDN